MLPFFRGYLITYEFTKSFAKGTGDHLPRYNQLIAPSRNSDPTKLMFRDTSPEAFSDVLIIVKRICTSFPFPRASAPSELYI